MHLTPRETEKLMLHCAGELAKSRLQRGIKLNYPEVIAYISSELLEMAREGMSVTELMRYGKKLLKKEDVMDGIPEMVHEIQIEATFKDGTKLVTVHNPIQGESESICGEMIIADGDILLNENKDTAQIVVSNTADRPIQVGSHFHFFEVNKQLSFNRSLAYGMRLDIPAGTAVRFEPGESKKVNLVEIGGDKKGYGLNGLVTGDMATNKEMAIAKAKELNFKDEGGESNV